MLDAELAAYHRAAGAAVLDARSAARRAPRSQQARAVPAPGPVLARQVATRGATSSRPPRRRCASLSRPTTQTEVSIYRVGRLGAFDRKDVELLPGRYTVVGMRAGFRDVRRELTWCRAASHRRS